MATKYVRIGSSENVIAYDDGDYSSAIETTEPIKSGTPSDPNDVVRLEDLTEIAGFIESKFGVSLLSALNSRQDLDKHTANHIIKVQVFS